MSRIRYVGATLMTWLALAVVERVVVWRRTGVGIEWAGVVGAALWLFLAAWMFWGAS